MTARLSFAIPSPSSSIRVTPTQVQIFQLRSRPRCRAFHASGSYHLEDHYATLQIRRGANSSEIKKSFYNLSKTWHPDRNPNNQQEASKKFVAVSDAYHVLGDSKKREKYDAELAHASDRGHSTSGSYSSASGASSYSPGGRKASGLSKRRGSFRGPPPSFYRSGGWGGSGEKRSTNTGPDEAFRKQQQEQRQQQGTYGPYRGTTGSWPFSTDPNDVGHFDREGHFKTQTTVEQQLRKGRHKRRGILSAANDMTEDGGSVNAMGKFFMVLGTLTVGLAIPALFLAGKAG